MMKRAMVVGIPAGLLVVCLALSYMTRGAMASLGFLQGGGVGAAAQEIVDQKPWQTASALAPLAVSAEEQGFAREAERLADHEVDQAFAMALRQASMETRVLTGPALEAQQRVAAFAAEVKDDQARVDDLTARVAAATKGGGDAPGAMADDLEVAKAQLQLDTDQENDAQEDMTRESGDKREVIQQELAAREASMKKFDAQLNGGEVAVIAARRFNTLQDRVGAWEEQRSRRVLLAQAEAESDKNVAALRAEHAALEAKSGAAQAKVSGAAGASATGSGASSGKLAEMARVHTYAQIHAILDDRLQTEQQLAAVYAKWGTQVELQHRIVAHLILQSLTGLAAILLFGALAWWGVGTLAGRSMTDPRRQHTLRKILRIAVEVVTLLAVALLIFGPPQQVPTILGLATAGLTVVFQSFILAFFGWFVLMGRNGFRVGDWVEINGVGGEVVEIGVFRTTLLETGNWTSKGHPTGRRVAFTNNFAVTGQYFNFSTVGQWMWDEISVNIPAGSDTSKTIEAIQAAVLGETGKDAKLAEAEWQHQTRQGSLSQFSATPSVDMRPAASGVDVLVRYITRASDRFELRNRLYQAFLKLLQEKAQG